MNFLMLYTFSPLCYTGGSKQKVLILKIVTPLSLKGVQAISDSTRGVQGGGGMPHNFL